MQLSVEMRWFWRDTQPTVCADLFRWDNSDSSGEERVDQYLRDDRQNELGIKLRGSKPGVEVKGLISREGFLDVAPFIGRIEVWAKWSSRVLELRSDLMVTVHKRR